MRNPFQISELQSQQNLQLQQNLQNKQQLTDEDIYYHQVDAEGNVAKYKKESGVPVEVEKLGNIKNFFNLAIRKAAVLSPKEIIFLDVGSMTHIEIAALRMAENASLGDSKAMQELLDRVLGKAKQVSESTNLNLTLDDVLQGVPEYKGDV